MNTATISFSIQHEAELLGQTVVVIGGSAGTGLETTRRACAEGHMACEQNGKELPQ